MNAFDLSGVKKRRGKMARKHFGGNQQDKKEAPGKTHERLSFLLLNVPCTSGITSCLGRNAECSNYKSISAGVNG